MKNNNKGLYSYTVPFYLTAPLYTYIMKEYHFLGYFRLWDTFTCVFYGELDNWAERRLHDVRKWIQHNL